MVVVVREKIQEGMPIKGTDPGFPDYIMFLLWIRGTIFSLPGKRIKPDQ